VDRQESEISEIELTTEELDRVSGGFWFNPTGAGPKTEATVPWYIGRYGGFLGLF
jgi:hypothetical protein